MRMNIHKKAYLYKRGGWEIYISRPKMYLELQFKNTMLRYKGT